MASIGDIALGLAEQLSAVTGVKGATDYYPERFAQSPIAFVNLGEITESTYGFESLTVKFDAIVAVARGVSPRIGQRSLYDFYTPVAQAINDNADLGLGDGTNARVVQARGMTVDDTAGLSYYAVAFEVEVTTPG